MFGEYLRSLREAKGYTLRDFAKEMGIVASYLSDIERDCRNVPNYEMLEKISTKLGLTEAERNKLFALAINDKSNLPPDIIEAIRKDPNIFSVIRMFCNSSIVH